MNFSLKFQLELSSDYHLSSGHRSEEVDSALFRDADGLPALRGTTVAALLRDGMRRLILTGALKNVTCNCQASGLPEKIEGKEPPEYCGQFEKLLETKFCPVCKIFGSPKSFKAWSVSSARPSGLNAPDTGQGVMAEWGAQEVMRVRIDPRTRRAEARKLFSQEEGDSRLIFEFTVTSATQNEHENAQAALIVAAARMVRNFGGARRRGRGECLFTLIEAKGKPANNDAWLDDFQSIWIEGKPTTNDEDEEKSNIVKPHRQAASGTALRLRLIVRADEPILVARRAESGNEFEGLRSIPGTVVRGAFAQKAAAKWGGFDDDLRTLFWELFFSGKLCFTPLYPALQDGTNIRPAFPAPRDFHTCKLHCGLDETDADVIWHLRRGSSLSEAECLRCGEALEPMEEFLYISKTGELKNMRIRNGLEMHNTINPNTERVEETNLFAYQPLESGQYFIGEIVCDDENLWSLLKDFAGLLELDKAFSLSLGKASRRGYGRATAVLVKPKSADSPPLWIGRPLVTRVSSANDNETLVLTLLSDAIIPDCWGRFYTGFEEASLRKELGIEVTIVEQFVAAREVDSFNAHLGLPRWRDVAIAAGSSCKIQIRSREIEKLKALWAQQTGNNEASPDAALHALHWRLNKLEVEGVGVRRNEGFGGIAFNHPLYENAAILKDWWFPLPQALQLRDDAQKTGFSFEPRFRKDWNEILDELNLEACHGSKFGAVARLFRAEKYTGIAVLQERLTKLGERDNLDGGLPKNESNWFKKKGGKGVELIDTALNRLASHIAMVTGSQEIDKRLSAIGIELLAERIAEEALKDQGEKR